MASYFYSIAPPVIWRSLWSSEIRHQKWGGGLTLLKCNLTCFTSYGDWRIQSGEETHTNTHTSSSATFLLVIVWRSVRYKARNSHCKAFIGFENGFESHSAHPYQKYGSQRYTLSFQDTSHKRSDRIILHSRLSLSYRGSLCSCKHLLLTSYSFLWWLLQFVHKP